MDRVYARMGTAAVLAALCGAAIGASQQTPPSQQQPPRPVFRGAVSIVTVDVYATRNGQIVDDLKAEDFEILENGAPQKIERFEFVRANAVPDAVPRDPNNQRDMLEQLADPKSRVFVVFLDTYHNDFFGAVRTETPIALMLNHLLAPTDLFAAMTQQTEIRHLTFARNTQTVDEELRKVWPVAVYDNQSRSFPEPEEAELIDCYANSPQLAAVAAVIPEVISRRREERVLTSLDHVAEYLGGVREGRKTVFIVSAGWQLDGQSARIRHALGSIPQIPRPPRGITSEGKLRLGVGHHDGSPWDCDSEVRRVGDLDNHQHWRDLLKLAAAANVAFYPLDPTGLGATRTHVDDFLTMAEETNGSAVTMTNDLRTGMQQIAQGLSAYYLLGYSPTDTKADGLLRSIKVKVKRPGIDLKARRGYRAYTEREMASLRSAVPAPAGAAPDAEAAQSALARLRPSTSLYTYAQRLGAAMTFVAELPAGSIDAGRWRQGADVTVMVSGAGGETAGMGKGRIEPGARSAQIRVPIGSGAGPWQAMVRVQSSGETSVTETVAIAAAQPALVGEALVYRVTGGTPRPVAGFQFLRSERVRVEWPALKALDRREARLLDRNGQPLPVPLAVTEPAAGTLAADVALASLAPGDYVLELIAAAGAISERRYVALRVLR